MNANNKTDTKGDLTKIVQNLKNGIRESKEEENIIESIEKVDKGDFSDDS